jgi:hypothetical protein
MNKSGMDGSVLDHPNDIMPNQAGSNDKEMKNDKYEKGLRYAEFKAYLFVLFLSFFLKF